MAGDTRPVVLELAPLPREQIGPFLLLGLDKSAEVEEIEAHWAHRLIWARKNLLRVGLEEINWAREVLRDPERRLSADVTSLNPDTVEGMLRKMEQRFLGSRPWQPLDVEKSVGDYAPPLAIPTSCEYRAILEAPQLPPDAPAVSRLLEEWLRQPLDPWSVELPQAANSREVS